MNIGLPQERWGPAQGKAVSTLENELCRQWTCIFCSLDINLQKVCSILWRNRHHWGVCHHSLKSVGKAPEDPGHGLIGHDWMSNPVSIMPNETWSLQHLGVTVNHGGNDVLPVQSQEPLMQLVLRTRCQNVEVHQFHPSVWRKQFVAQAMFRVLDLRAIVTCLIEVYH